MPYIDKVVIELNDYLKAGRLNRKAFQGGIYHGLSRQMKVIDKDSNKMYPVILDKDGNDLDVTIDDTPPIHVYHRITQPLQFGVIPDKNSFGNADSVTQEVSTLSMIVFADPKRICMTSEDLAFLIASGIPRQFTLSQIGSSGVSSCSIGIVNIETNPYTVLSQEYGAMNKSIDPEKTLISINYKITMSVNKNCMDCIDC